MKEITATTTNHSLKEIDSMIFVIDEFLKSVIPEETIRPETTLNQGIYTLREARDYFHRYRKKTDEEF